MQVRYDMDVPASDPDDADDGFHEADSLPPGCLGAAARALMARGRRLSTIYSRVSAFSGGSVHSTDSQAGCSSACIYNYLNGPCPCHATSMILPVSGSVRHV